MIDWPRRKPKSAGSGWVRDAVANVIVGRASVVNRAEAMEGIGPRRRSWKPLQHGSELS